MPGAFFNSYANFVASVAVRFAPVVKRYGWDADDCCQHAYMKLWKLSARDDLRSLSADGVKKYLAAVVKRSIYRAAVYDAAVPYETTDEVKRTVEGAESKTQDFEAYLLTEVLADAPGEIGQFLRDRLLDGKQILDIAWDREWTRGRLVKVRAEAAEWLLAQFEGRKMARG